MQEGNKIKDKVAHFNVDIFKFPFTWYSSTETSITF